jgi:hypothetical protein
VQTEVHERSCAALIGVTEFASRAIGERLASFKLVEHSEQRLNSSWPERRAWTPLQATGIESTSAMTAPLDIDQLTALSREFARQFLVRFPTLSSSCSSEVIEGVPGRHLLIRVDSPAGSDRNVTMWMESGDEPSLAFGTGGWHTHNEYTREVEPGLYRAESLLDVLQAILGDEFVVLEEPDAAPRPFSSVLDLRGPSALLDELTSPHCSKRVRLKSFTGRRDREVSLDDLEG